MTPYLVIEDVSTGEPDVSRVGSKRKPDTASAVRVTGASTSQGRHLSCPKVALGKNGDKFGGSMGVLITHIRTKHKKVGRSAAIGEQNWEALA